MKDGTRRIVNALPEAPRPVEESNENDRAESQRGSRNQSEALKRRKGKGMKGRGM
jgi:hypothetical protein